MPANTMKTVCLLGSPRHDGNSDTLANSFLHHASALGAPTEVFKLADLQYNGCKNLFRCKTDLDHCGQVDDLTPVLNAVSQAQVLVLASPVYFTTITGQLKLALDRFFSFFVPDYATAERRSRLTGERHVVLVQTQGESEENYAGLLDSFAHSFDWMGFENRHLIRACGVRQPGDIKPDASVLKDCK